MNTTEALSKFYERLHELEKIHGIASLLSWDQSTYMPPAAGDDRAKQCEYLARLAHQKEIESERVAVVNYLYENIDSLSDDDQVNVREVHRRLMRQLKLPDEFVAEFAELTGRTYNVWVKARPQNDWDAVKPLLAKIVEMLRRKCDLIGYESHPYDALIDIHEPGMTYDEAKPLLTQLADQLRTLLPAITTDSEVATEFAGTFDPAEQKKLCEKVARALGYDFERGRLDTTAHPFMTAIGPTDFRITTRFDDRNFVTGFYAAIHETGHALYEMGLPVEHHGTPLAWAASSGVHESQSRLWENLVGRSRQFCEFAIALVAEFFPETAKELGADGLWRCANRVKPSLIRVDADEATYSQHIVIRMLLEERLILGELGVEGLPEAWTELYENYLGVTPDNYSNGVMQDVHWFTGHMGYFPSYALGNLYNAAMYESALAEIPELPGLFARGDFGPLLSWLRKNVHQHGRRYRAGELLQRITGKPLSVDPFLDYLRRKFAEAV